PAIGASKERPRFAVPRLSVTITVKPARASAWRYGSTVSSQDSQTYWEWGPPYTHTTAGPGAASAERGARKRATWSAVTPSAAGNVSRSGTTSPTGPGRVDGSCRVTSGSSRRERTTTCVGWLRDDQLSTHRSPLSLTVTACQPGSAVSRRGRTIGLRASSATTYMWR